MLISWDVVGCTNPPATDEELSKASMIALRIS